MIIKNLKKLSPILLKKYQKTVWSAEQLDACPYFVASAAQIMTNEVRRYFPEFRIAVSYIHGRYMTWHCQERDFEAAYQKVIKIFRKNPQYFSGLKEKWREDIKNFYNLCQRYKYISLKNLGDKDLAKKQINFFKYFKKSAAIPFFIEGITVGSAKIVDESLRRWTKLNKLVSSFSTIYQTLTTPEQPSFVNQSQLELLRLLKSPDGMLKQYAQKYSWLRNNYFSTYKLTLADVKKEIAYLLKEKITATELFDLRKIKKDKTLVIKKYKIARWLLKELSFLGELGHWQDERKRSIFIGTEIMDKFLTELSRRVKIDKKLLKYCLPEEYEQILKRNFDYKLLKARKNNFLAIWQPGQVIIFSGRIAKKYNIIIFNKNITESIKEFKGIPAAGGGESSWNCKNSFER